MGPVAGNAKQGQMNRKQVANLAARQREYFQMIAKPRSDGWIGYHKPGSNQR